MLLLYLAQKKIQYLRFTFLAAMWSMRIRPQFVYGSDPLSCLPALWACRLGGSRLIYHEHDSPGMEKGALYDRMISKYRRTAARRSTNASV